MELQLKNIGMIKEANVKIDGLTVIAGENDTGKSTLGKALLVIYRSLPRLCFSTEQANNQIDVDISSKYKEVFKEEFTRKQTIVFKTKFATYISKIDLSNGIRLMQGDKTDSLPANILFIESPLIWNFTDFFRDIAQVESQMRIKLDYPYFMKNLNFVLFIKSASKGLDIKERISSLMGGEFKKDEMGRYYFDKNGEKIELINTATGIKYFAIFQVLSQNNHLDKDLILILDEPEVHLHPKWQLEMAKIIVELVKNGVKIVVNSHSPYMIEALKRYSEVEKIKDKTNFYLAENGYIKQIENSNSLTLEQIFEKLSEPFDVFDKMDSERLQNG